MPFSSSKLLRSTHTKYTLLKCPSIRFFKVVQAHGWEAIQQFIAQDIQWVRGTATPIAVMSQNNSRAVTFTTGTGFSDGSSGFFQQLPEDDFSHIIIWSQRAAIFETAEHPAAAKLYVNWLLSTERQAASGGWSVRNDVPQQSGLARTSRFIFCSGINRC